MPASATKTKGPKGKTTGGPEPEPLTSPCVLTPEQALYAGKSLQKAGKTLEEKAKARGAKSREGECEIDLDLRLVDRPITKKASAGTLGYTRTEATIGVLDVLIALVADECGADATKIDAFLKAAIARRTRVLATEKGEALLANVAEILPPKVDEHARVAGFVTTVSVPGSPGAMGAVTCDPSIEVRKVRK